MSPAADTPSHWSQSDLAALAARLLARHRQSQAARHRLPILVSGEPSWTRSRATAICRAFSPLEPIWLTDRQAGVTETLPLRSARMLLGRDLDLVVYDAHGGFDPDDFGVVCGAILGGGVLVLLTPPLACWPQLPDPQAERIAVWPFRSQDLTGRFLERLSRVLARDPYLVQIAQDGPISPPHPAAPAPPDAALPPHPAAPSRADPAVPCTADQRLALEAVLKTARGRARRPLVLRAHRGRGKSAALGLAAGRLLAEGGRRILLTAPAGSAVETLLRHTRAVLAAADSARRGSPDDLRFVPPAQLIEERPHADLLLVDEAAGIPTPLLEGMLRHYGRVVFATTVHGYEGTGRGFDLRFRERLDRLTPEWRTLELREPVRWGADDPLEALCFRALLLDAAPAADAPAATATPAACTCERLDRERLAEDEETLRQLFGLLVLAHYQTRPMDLRMLLDGPNVRILVLRHAGQVVATLLAATEGGFAEVELREAIYLGQRRPHGHLLPQTLSAHAGLREAPAYRYLRVLRITVHPTARGRGLGRMLLEALIQEARTEGMDLTGASFGATPELVRFWHRCGHVPVQIGSHRNAASGEHAVVVLKGLSQAGRALTAKAQRRLESALGVLLPGPLRDLDPAIALAVSVRLPPTERPDGEPPESRHELHAFAAGHRPLESSLPLLASLVRGHLAEALERGFITEESAQLLLAASRQLRPPAELVRLFGHKGRDDLLTALRQAADGLQHALRPSARGLDAQASAL